MNKIEQVARAICVADSVDPDMIIVGIGAVMPVGWTGSAWMVREKQARAAIEAMREPTILMDEAPAKEIPECGSFTSRTAWVAMIDAALKEE